MASSRLVGGARGHLPGVVIGLGLGGFFDGIVLHQLLQWHHLVSNRIPPDTLPGLEQNTFFDGVFHQAMWLVTIAGVVLLYRRLAYGSAAASSGLLGGVLIGFGVFNVIDSIVFHWLLGLHNIRPGVDWLVYDAAFFCWGLAMVVAGAWLIRRRGRVTAEA
jgi:uncharacterized membrane protein